ncbi:Kinesin-16 [Giardia duodenalis]|uniref:Kinesin-like protein n=2 Tax=Giardia intestinalis TaxID=5741 RepID=A8BMQ2_GIAIC|nr:Kinesin-16 [Giardia intestinalis]KAE8304049.1 Kinesin-16 [Giardia intestinalis]|eukprot:XP_001706146.1 Kinesin-16 [Giardia lamblia ATCC 50803]
MQSNFSVCVRVRPLIEREIRAREEEVIQISDESKVITILEPMISSTVDTAAYARHSFTFNQVFGPNVSQAQVYNQQCKQIIDSVFRGFNATILAYGQTGTGKSFTISGTPTEPGIIPRAIEDIFAKIHEAKDTQFLLRASFLQLYKEQLQDLLDTRTKNLRIREQQTQDGVLIYVDNLSEFIVRNPQELFQLLEHGGKNRKIGPTHMNVESSRSHSVFSLTIEQRSTTCDGGIILSKLNIVDLAGSERISMTKVNGERLEETKKINSSLTALGNVIAALIDLEKGKRSHIPYRDSKLTKLLQDSLGGNCKTIFIANVTPSSSSYQETLNTLKFADRARKIQNKAHINEKFDSKVMIKRYEKEILRLRQELKMLQSLEGSQLDGNGQLCHQSTNIVSTDKYTADRTAIYSEIESKSREVLEEKSLIKKLQDRIILLESYLQDNTGQTRAVSDDANDWVAKLNQIELERNELLNEKRHIEQYREMLLKQKDIIISLTGKLDERDKHLSELNEQLEEADDEQQNIEDEIVYLRRAVRFLAGKLKLGVIVDGEGNLSDEFCRENKIKPVKFMREQHVFMDFTSIGPGPNVGLASEFLAEMKEHSDTSTGSTCDGQTLEQERVAGLQEILLEKQLEEEELRNKILGLNAEIAAAEKTLSEGIEQIMATELADGSASREWGSNFASTDYLKERERYVQILKEASHERSLVLKIFTTKLKPMLEYVGTLIKSPDYKKSVYKQMLSFENFVLGTSEALVNSTVAQKTNNLTAIPNASEIAPEIQL